MKKIKLLIAFLLALYVQHDWATGVVQETEQRNKSLQLAGERQLLSAQITSIVCDLDTFPQFQNLDDKQLTLEVLQSYSSSAELGKFIRSSRVSNNGELILECLKIPEDRIESLKQAVKSHYGADYFEVVSKDEELLEDVLVRTLKQQIEKEVAGFEITVDKEAVINARIKGFLIAFLLAALVLLAGRNIVVFFYYFITSKQQAKTLDELSVQVNDAWHKTVGRDTMENRED